MKTVVVADRRRRWRGGDRELHGRPEQRNRGDDRRLERQCRDRRERWRCELASRASLRRSIRSWVRVMVSSTWSCVCRAGPEHGLGRLRRRRQRRRASSPRATSTYGVRRRRSRSRPARRPRSCACRSSIAWTCEGLEAFTFALSAAVNGAIARASGRISIVDNDTVVATPRLFVRDAVVDEKDGTALRLGAPRRYRRPGLEQHGDGRLRDRERHGERRAPTTRRAPARSPSPPARRPRPWSCRSPTTRPLEAIESFAARPEQRNRGDHRRRRAAVVAIGASDGVASSQPSVFAPVDVDRERG